MKPLAVIATGMVTGVGLDAPSSCAAIRCAIDNFQETRFIDRGGEWIVASEVPLDPPTRGRSKLVRMAASAAGECLPALPDVPTDQVPLILCVAETERPGRLSALDDSLIAAVSQSLGVTFAATSRVISNGIVGGVQAIETAFGLINESGAPYVLVAGTDTLLVARTLTALDQAYRLLTPDNSNGLIPGEGAVAVLLGPAAARPVQAEFVLRGVGFGREPATITSDEPFKADGMAQTLRAALQNAGCTYDDVNYRITDISGEQYAFKEAALAAARTMKQVKQEYDIWHPAECIGDIGAALVPCMLAVAKAAAEKDYAMGDGVLIHCANDDEQRAAIIGSFVNPESDHGQ